MLMEQEVNSFPIVTMKNYVLRKWGG